MELDARNVARRTRDAKGFVPSIIKPLELSERSDSKNSGPQKANEVSLIPASEEVENTLVDKRLVDEASAWISSKIAVTLNRGAQEIGEYVLARFFGGDPILAKSQNPHKNASFRALSERCGTAELPVSKTWLNNAVGVAVMIRRLPEPSGAFKALPPSFQASLLPLRDPTKVEKVASVVTTKELSVRELKKVVAEECAKTPKDTSRGRPSTPAIAKAVSRSLRLFSWEGNKRAFSRAEVDELDDDQRKDIIRSVRILMERLRDLAGKLKRA